MLKRRTTFGLFDRSQSTSSLRRSSSSVTFPAETTASPSSRKSSLSKVLFGTPKNGEKSRRSSTPNKPPPVPQRSRKKSSPTTLNGSSGEPSDQPGRPDRWKILARKVLGNLEEEEDGNFFFFDRAFILSCFKGKVRSLYYRWRHRPCAVYQPTRHLLYDS